MTSINDKLGLKRAGKRAMMKLPKNRAEAARITSSRCPSCRFYAAIAFESKGPNWVFCAHCSESWELEAK